MSNPQRRWMRWAVRSIGFVIFAYLLHRIGPGKIWDTIRSVQIGFFAAALPIFFLMIGVGLLRGKRYGWYFQVAMSTFGLLGLPLSFLSGTFFVLPIGTILNILILVFFFQPSVRDHFKT